MPSHLPYLIPFSPSQPFMSAKKKVMELSKTHLEGISKAYRRLAEARGGEVSP